MNKKVKYCPDCGGKLRELPTKTGQLKRGCRACFLRRLEEKYQAVRDAPPHKVVIDMTHIERYGCHITIEVTGYIEIEDVGALPLGYHEEILDIGEVLPDYQVTKVWYMKDVNDNWVTSKFTKGLWTPDHKDYVLYYAGEIIEIPLEAENEMVGRNNKTIVSHGRMDIGKGDGIRQEQEIPT